MVNAWGAVAWCTHAGPSSRYMHEWGNIGAGNTIGVTPHGECMGCSFSFSSSMAVNRQLSGICSCHEVSLSFSMLGRSQMYDQRVRSGVIQLLHRGLPPPDVIQDSLRGIATHTVDELALVFYRVFASLVIEVLVSSFRVVMSTSQGIDKSPRADSMHACDVRPAVETHGNLRR